MSLEQAAELDQHAERRSEHGADRHVELGTTAMAGHVQVAERKTHVGLNDVALLQLAQIATQEFFERELLFRVERISGAVIPRLLLGIAGLGLTSLHLLVLLAQALRKRMRAGWVEAFSVHARLARIARPRHIYRVRMVLVDQSRAAGRQRCRRTLSGRRQVRRWDSRRVLRNRRRRAAALGMRRVRRQAGRINKLRLLALGARRRRVRRQARVDVACRGNGRCQLVLGQSVLSRTKSDSLQGSRMSGTKRHQGERSSREIYVIISLAPAVTIQRRARSP